MTRALLVVWLLGCDGGAGVLDGGGDAGSDAGTAADAALPAWSARVVRDEAILAPSPEDACLRATSDVAGIDSVHAVLAADDRFVVIDERGRALPAAAVELSGAPDPSAGRAGTVQIDTRLSRYDAGGCPVEESDLVFGTIVTALARSHDANYRGHVVIGADLALAPVRHVGAAGWTYPWHAAVQLVKQVPEGFVIGGGVLLDERTLLTAAHLGLDSTWCYSREPRAGDAWAAGRFVCDNIAVVRTHPSVDAAVATLTRPEAAPFARVRAGPVLPSEEVYANRFGLLLSHAFADARVENVGSVNAYCDSWPDGTSFFTRDLVVGPGDSGGPAWIGDELVGLVHGEACRATVLDPMRHVFVHVPAITDLWAGP